MDPSAPLQTLPGIGPVRSRRLAEVGYRTVGDLLGHLPARYEDRSTVLSVAEAVARFRSEQGAAAVTVRGRLEAVRPIRLRRRRLSMVRARLRDASGALDVLWFNRPYLASTLDPELDYLLHGRLRPPKQGRRMPRAADDNRKPSVPELINPSCEAAERALRGGRIVPVYPALGPLGPATVRRLLFRALEDADLDAFPEPIPEDLLTRHGLPALGPSLRQLHLPDAETGPGADVLNRWSSPAHRRLIYGELLEQQIALAELRRRRRKTAKRHRYDDPEALRRARRVARSVLPFRLTADQRRALDEIATDLRRPEPMARLLQGDVGSGKTIVAVLALILCVESGLQGAFMAPTELLAEQHHRRLRKLLGDRYRIGILTGSGTGSETESASRSMPQGAAAREELAAGRLDLVVGTHALIQEEIAFRRLGLAVIDEQHRFGVVQRRSLQEKGDRPDVLVMTATPIPRTLALTAYGDLDLSVITELPPGRRPPATEVRLPEDRDAVYEELAERLESGERAFVVFPRIRGEVDPGDDDGGENGSRAPSLEVEGAELRARLAERLVESPGEDVVAVVHGGTTAEERERVMEAFAEGRVRVLLATTVIEVGVDVPEATVLVIEGAERFGLSQLHQLRGRVGRGSALRRSARCIAIPASAELSESGRARMEAFASTTDGFEIAERDLELRGFGELLGTRQSGTARFRVADPVRHRELLELARADARGVVDRLGEPGLEILSRRVARAVRRAEAESGAG